MPYLPFLLSHTSTCTYCGYECMARESPRYCPSCGYPSPALTQPLAEYPVWRDYAFLIRSKAPAKEPKHG